MFNSTDKLITIAAARDQLGQMWAFGTADTSPNDSVSYANEQAPGGNWTAWRDMFNAGDRLVSIGASRNNGGFLEAFGVNQYNQIYHAMQLVPSGGWACFPGRPTNCWWNLAGPPPPTQLDSIAVGQNDSNPFFPYPVEVFGVATDNTVWHIYEMTSTVDPKTGSPNAGSWSPWQKLENSGLTPPHGIPAGIAPDIKLVTAARNSNGHMEVFGIAGDNTVWHFYEGGYVYMRNWMQLSKKTDQFLDLSAVLDADGKLELFGTKPDYTIMHTSQSAPGTWPMEAPDKPPSPIFTGVSGSRFTITKPSPPDLATSLRLEQRVPFGRYKTLKSNMLADFTMSGLKPGSSFTFRFEAVGAGGTVSSDWATVTTLPWFRGSRGQ